MATDKKGRTPVCRFMTVVECPDKAPKCDKCGWNPKVERRRKRKIEKEHTHVIRGY